MRDGIGLTVAMQAFSILDRLAPVEGMGPVGEVRLMPDPETFRVLPYAPRAAAMTADMRQLDGTPWDACPRAFLKRQIEAFRLDRAAGGVAGRAALGCAFRPCPPGPSRPASRAPACRPPRP